MSVLKMAEWQAGSGRYMVNFPDILTKNNAFRATELIFEMSTIEFLLDITEKFNAEIELIKTEDGNIKWYYYWFHSAADCHKFVLMVNRLARQKNITTDMFE